MESVKSLNAVIEKELMLKQLDGTQKLQELLAIAEKLYRNVVNVFAQYRDNENNNVIIPNEVLVLGDNIARIKQELLGYGVDVSQNSEESKGMKR